MVQASRSLDSKNALLVWRQAMFQEILATVVFKCGQPSEEALAYKNRILDLCLADARHLLTRRVLLEGLPNGDWRIQDAVEIYIIGTMPDDAERVKIAKRFATGIIQALCFATPWLYPLSRWIGAHMACDEILLMEACHGLLYRTMQRMCLLLGDKIGRIRSGKHHVQMLALTNGTVALPIQDEASAAAEGQAGYVAADDGNADPQHWAKVSAGDRRRSLLG